MLRCVVISHSTSFNLLEWRRAYIVMFYANKTQHYSTWYYVKESLFWINRHFIVIFDPQNMGLDNLKKIYISNIERDIDKFSFFGNDRRYWLPANFE